MIEQQQLNQQISAATGQPFTIQAINSIAGGCINQACELVGESQSFFVKFNNRALLPMFEAEFSGLQEISALDSIKVPNPVACGLTDKHSFLVLEMIHFGTGTAKSSRLMGQQLAKLHQSVQPYFGWHRDNTIGSTGQVNGRYQDWVSFWRQQRLGFQLNLAAKAGYRGRLQKNGERLCAELGAFFTDYQPNPALLHGDLWGGNARVDRAGNPVIFDPACYYGDHEADLAMTELFGGFGADFYAAYRDTLSVDAGYAVRKTLYNLYHILNHLNLFGGGYLSQAEAMLEKLLAELK